MASNHDDQLTIRRYLLGQLDEEDHKKLEQQLLVDDDVFEELLISEDELIDEYSSGMLNAEETEMFEMNFLATSERRQKVSFAKAFKRYTTLRASEDQSQRIQEGWAIRSTNAAWRRSFFTSTWKIAALAFVIVIAALGVWRILFYSSDVDKGLVALNNAYKQQRPIEARITNFDYAPFVTTRGAESDRVDSAERDFAERQLMDAVRDHPGAASYHALGKFYLTKKDFDKAITQFEAAIKADPNNAQTYADLGAALFEKGKIEIDKSRSDQTGLPSGQGLEYLSRSLESLKKALELNPELQEALFNRALAYEANGLFESAETDWKEYLKKDSTSYWAVEARQRLKRIEEQKHKVSLNPEDSYQRFINAYEAQDESLAWELIGQNHTSGGNLILNSVLDSYLDQRKRDDKHHAVKIPESLLYIDSLMVQRGEDHYVSDLARFYYSVNRQKLPILEEARREMRMGYQLFIMSRFTDALESYGKAKQRFDSLGDKPEATFASYRMGHCYVLEPNSKRGQEILKSVFSIAQDSKYKWLLSQSFYQLANIQIGFSEYSKAIEYSNRALKLAEDLGDTNGLVKSLIQLADEYRSLNDRSRSFGFLERSLNALSDGPLEPMQAWQSYIGIALNLSAFGFNFAALEFQKEALRIAIQMERPLIKSRSYQFLGGAYAKLKQYDEALQQLKTAIEIGRTLQDEPNGIEMIANASVQLGDIYRNMGNYGEAIAAFNQSLELYRKLNFRYFTYAAHKGKLLSYIAQADDKATAAEIDTVLKLFKEYRAEITEQGQRNSFFDAQQYIYDVAIDYEYARRKNPQQAFDYSESSRARSLHDLVQADGNVVETGPIPELNSLSPSEPLTFTEIQRKLPADTTLLQYAVLEGKLLIWVLSSKELQTREVNISATALAEKIRAYRNALDGTTTLTETETREQAKALYQTLIEPVQQFLTTTNICVIPDKTLHYLPFAALVSPRTGNYLIKDHRLQVSPSATLFVEYSRIAGERTESGDERLLSLGNPNFERSAFPSLPALPSADREAEEISHFYDRRTGHLFLNEKATQRNFENGAPKADVIHIAAHYVANDWSEMLSKLLLARDPGASSRNSSGAMQASDIYKMKFSRTRLVVLSACQTGIERQYEGEGAIGLARPFLASGVPLVVASLWPVDSEATAELMIRFHRYRTEGKRPSMEALQLAQLDMIQNQNPAYRKPYYWASFVAIGGKADF